MHIKDIVFEGKDPAKSGKALVMIHGRGASPEDILSLSTYLNVDDFTLAAPRATNNTWYPFSFLAPPQQNQPWLSSALDMLGMLVEELKQKGITQQNIYFAGFSQGACLTLEFAARNAGKWGGFAAFTGGLIGDKIYKENYKGNFEGTPIFIGSSDPDPHVPVERVKESAAVLEKMNASVTCEIYMNLGHTISREEIDKVNALIFSETGKSSANR